VVTAVPWWEVARDLVIVCAFLAGYGWLAVLSARVRVVSRRLGAHVCREPGKAPRASGPPGKAPRARGAPTAVETTQPITAAQARDSDQERGR
jgi:hypothetical protein